jgi:hypothetical protein
VVEAGIYGFMHSTAFLLLLHNQRLWADLCHAGGLISKEVVMQAARLVAVLNPYTFV